jgi:hypothetical protein
MKEIDSFSKTRYYSVTKLSSASRAIDRDVTQLSIVVTAIDSSIKKIYHLEKSRLIHMKSIYLKAAYLLTL